MTIDKLKGRQHQDLRERLIEEDARKHKEQNQSDMFGLFADLAPCVPHCRP